MSWAKWFAIRYSSHVSLLIFDRAWGDAEMVTHSRIAAKGDRENIERLESRPALLADDPEMRGLSAPDPSRPSNGRGGDAEALSEVVADLQQTLQGAESERDRYALQVVETATTGPGRALLRWNRFKRSNQQAERLIAGPLRALWRTARYRPLAGRRVNPLFDADWYVQTYPDVIPSGLSPYRHYRRLGARMGRRPNAFFDPQWYLETYPELQETGLDPLDHYYRYGCWEGKDPGPGFNTRWYLTQHPEVAETGMNALLHHMKRGMLSGFAALPVVAEEPPVVALASLAAPPAVDPAVPPAVDPDMPPTVMAEGRVEDHARLIAASVDQLFDIPHQGVFVIGWLFDPQHQVTAIRVRADGATTMIPLEDTVRLARPDIADVYQEWTRGGATEMHGFASFVALERQTVDAGAAVLIDFVSADDQAWSVIAPPARTDAASPQGMIHDLMEAVPAQDMSVLDNHIGPAVRALWASRDRTPPSFTVEDVGTLPTHPDVSIIVPVYGRYDLIEYQLSLFADDPDIRQAELIYVIDDPRIVNEAISLVRALEPIYRVPCRVVLCAGNNGFAGAINIGVSQATGRDLLLLNSDVMPKVPGWLSSLQEAYASTPDVGVLGARLLFPDGSLQHDGMSFATGTRYRGLWWIKHPGKGLPPARYAQDEMLKVPATTGACMLLSRKHFDQVGGLDEDYVVGDFEDSDLCLKLSRSGLASFVAPSVELYHLERQSQSLDGHDDERAHLTLYNAWLHTTRWSDAIEESMPGRNRV